MHFMYYIVFNILQCFENCMENMYAGKKTEKKMQLQKEEDYFCCYFVVLLCDKNLCSPTNSP